MEFKDLPADLQVIATDCLRQKLVDLDSTQKSQQSHWLRALKQLLLSFIFLLQAFRLSTVMVKHVCKKFRKLCFSYNYPREQLQARPVVLLRQASTGG